MPTPNTTSSAYTAPPTANGGNIAPTTSSNYTAPPSTTSALGNADVLATSATNSVVNSLSTATSTSAGRSILNIAIGLAVVYISSFIISKGWKAGQS